MSQNIERRPDGTLKPGTVLNPGGRPHIPRLGPKYDREALLQRLDDRNYDPIMEMIDIARDKATSPYLRFECAKEIASYIASKRKSVTIGDEAEGGNTIRIEWDNPPVDPPKKTVDTAQEQFTNAMNDAHGRIMDAVLSDEDDPRK